MNVSRLDLMIVGLDVILMGPNPEQERCGVVLNTERIGIRRAPSCSQVSASYRRGPFKTDLRSPLRSEHPKETVPSLPVGSLNLKFWIYVRQNEVRGVHKQK